MVKSPYYHSKRKRSSYTTPYEGKKLNKYGIPVGTFAPDIVQNNQPPTLKDQSFLAKNKPVPQKIKAKNVNALGLNGYTPASNFDVTLSGDSQYNGIAQTSAQNMGSGQSVQTGPQLMLSPSGQYVQNPWAKDAPKPKPKTQQGVSSGYNALPAYKPAKYKGKKYADAEFLAEIRALDREMQAYRTQANLDRNRAATQYSVSGRDLRQQKDRDLEDLINDFASRGIVLSGVYGDKVGEYNQLWGQENTNLDRQYKESLQDIRNQYSNFLREVGIQKEQARLAAVRRRAQKLGKF